MEKKKQQSTSYLPTQAGIDVLYTFISTLLEETIKNFYWMLLCCAAASIYLAMLIQSATLHSFISAHITETSQVSFLAAKKATLLPKRPTATHPRNHAEAYRYTSTLGSHSHSQRRLTFSHFSTNRWQTSRSPSNPPPPEACHPPGGCSSPDGTQSAAQPQGSTQLPGPSFGAKSLRRGGPLTTPGASARPSRGGHPPLPPGTVPTPQGARAPSAQDGTLRTGVRYSATSRAFPFTVLMTFCIPPPQGHGSDRRSQRSRRHRQPRPYPDPSHVTRRPSPRSPLPAPSRARRAGALRRVTHVKCACAHIGKTGRRHIFLHTPPQIDVRITWWGARSGSKLGSRGQLSWRMRQRRRGGQGARAAARPGRGPRPARLRPGR